MSQPKDPFADREAANYTQPIVSREFILKTLEQAQGPQTYEALIELFGLADDDSLEALRRRLNAMIRDGQLLRNRKGAFGCIDKLSLIRGRIQAHRDGYGFLTPTDSSDDIYLSFRQMRKVFDGDEALVRLFTDGSRKREGAIVEVLSHNTEQVIGRFCSEKGASFVRPDNPRQTHDVMLSADSADKATPGQFVLVNITRQPNHNNPPLGEIAEVVGDHMAPGMEIDVAIRAHSIPHIWPDAVTKEAAVLGAEVAEADKRGRVDLRDKPLVTIDGEDARDFDDAVYCEKKKSGGWRLYVAIADVSHYVPIDSALDKEATLRATSVYFPDHVVPMLPEAISNGLCSLNPHVDRLAIVCEMSVSSAGKVSRYKFYEAVIHSHARLTYTLVGKMIDEAGNAKSEVRKTHASIIPTIDTLTDLYQALREARSARGAIDFETVETRIQFDKHRKIEQIVPVVRNHAHKLIEECMLCANVSAARFIDKHKLAGLFRVHSGPKEQKLINLRAFLSELGLSLGGAEKPTPADYQALLSTIGDRPDAHVIQTVMLRSLSQAVYQPDNDGHFGLAYTAYAHFTSPIRRYPDLLIHRALRHVIRSKVDSIHVKRVPGVKALPKERIYPYSMSDMMALGEQSSVAERRADEATRDVVSWLKCEFLQDHVGDEFEGIVTGVTHFGLFVELKDLYVEGLVHISSLPADYYQFEPAFHRLIGERTRQVFGLGDSLTVRVVSVNLDERKVDFECVSVVARGKKARTKLAKPEGKADGKKKSGSKRKSKSKGASKAKSSDKASEKSSDKPSGKSSDKPKSKKAVKGKADSKPASAKPKKRKPKKKKASE
ncbi:ribonuclease R [bacterium]|nr:ribonuclease R [bacterium]